MNNSRKVTLIISNRLAEEIRQRTNLSMQGEGKARQVFYLALPLWPASPACLLSAAILLRTREIPVLHGKEEQSQRCIQGAADGELYVFLGAGEVGQLLQQQRCVSQVSARAAWFQPAAARMAVGSLLSSCARLSCPQDDCVSWGHPHLRVPQKHRRSPFCQLSGPCQDKVVQRHSWRG